MRISRKTWDSWNGRDERPFTAVLTGRDYTALNVQNAQLRIWLPEPAKVALLEIVFREATSTTAYLTELFATYIFGYHEVLRMRDEMKGIYEPLRPEVKCMYNAESPAPPSFPHVDRLGKNIYAIKIFIPSRIKQTLQARSVKIGVSLGEFLRAIICQHLFGRSYGPNDYEVDAVEADHANRWENANDELG